MDIDISTGVILDLQPQLHVHIHIHMHVDVHIHIRLHIHVHMHMHSSLLISGYMLLTIVCKCYIYEPGWGNEEAGRGRQG
jgi:hypothetical protein